jgi:NAD(P)-dependent dehydrogenase (short-subunit alcohol dehydrogenase family)
MPHLMTRLQGLAAALVLVAAPAALLAAPAADAKAKAESPAEKVAKALDQKIDVEITDQTLDNAINQLKEQTKVNIVIDQVTLNNMGMVPANMQINVKQQGIKGRQALRAVLNQVHLGYAIIGDSVIVTTDDMAMHRQFKQKITVDLDKVVLETALKNLAKESAIQLLIDKKVNKEAQAAVSLQLEDVPFDTVIRLLCEDANLKPVRMGNVLYVTSKENAKELRTEPELAPSPYPGGGVPGVDFPVANPPGIGGIGGVGGIIVPIATPAPPPPDEKKEDKKEDEKKEDKKDDQKGDK